MASKMKKSRSSFIELNGDVSDSVSLKHFEQLEQNMHAAKKKTAQDNKSGREGYLLQETLPQLQELNGARV